LRPYFKVNNNNIYIIYHWLVDLDGKPNYSGEMISK